MNVGFVTHYYDRSEGTGGYAVEVVTRLARTHQVTLYAAGVRTPPPAGVTVVPVPAATSRAYATILTFPRAFAAVRRSHDIVHAQGWVTSDADVVTAHIVLAAWREAARAHGVRPPLGERLLGGWVAERERRFLGRARAVIAPSRRTALDIKRLTGRSEVAVVPHGCERALGVMPRAPARERCGVDPRAFAAVYIGDARKGLPAAVGALVAAPGAHLIALTAADRAPFDAHARQLGVAGRLHWAPAGTGADAVFGAADVVLMPSIYDTFGMVVGEALALGIPVITSKQSGASELVEHQRSAWVLEQPTAEAAGAALAELAGNAALRQTLSTEGRAVAARHTWDETVRRTALVYEQARRP